MSNSAQAEAHNKEHAKIRIKVSWHVLIGFIILFITIPLLIFLIQSKNVSNLPQGTKTPSSSFSPYQLARTHDELQSCAVKEKDNPIVEHVTTINDVIVGSYRGNINEYSYNASTNTASLVLISPKGDQTQLISLKAEKGLVYDAVSLKEIGLSDLKVGETVSISFNCFPKKNKLFKITRVNLTGKL